jgi:hypothetical protein|tara:strand:- start:591 stop:1034 length:444 start_codon:yes stop_codon:yes gene_type:complete
MAESIKSLFKPTKPKKYKGDARNIICRSSWERRFCNWCDTNESILEWGSEEFWIPYLSPIDNRTHRYFPDFIIKVKESTGDIKTYVIEVKPKRQTKPPIKKKRVSKSYLYEIKTYSVNQAKWNAASEWCKDRKIEFKIITENELGIK